MLIPKNIFPIVEIASKDEFRPNIMSVQLTRKDGKARAVATDGHALISAQWVEPKAEDFPLIEGKPNVASIREGFSAIVQRDDFKEMGKALPKKTNHPILEHVALNEVDAKERIEAVTHDASSAKTLDIKLVAGEYPDVNAVVPKDAPTFTISFNASLLSTVLKTVAAMSGERAPMVKLEFFSPGQPVRITHESSEGTTIESLVMPMRDKERK